MFISEWKISLPLNYVYWNSEEIEHVVQKMKLTTPPQAIYFIHLKFLRFLYNSLITISLNVVTQDKEYMWDISDEDQPKEIWKLEDRIHPDYALVLDNGYNGDISTGFIIHKGYLFIKC